MSSENIIPSGKNTSETKIKGRNVKVAQVLTFYDEPQLLLLRNKTQIFVAVAIPSKDGAKFFATSVQAGNWELYLNDRVNLRYLFVYPNKRMLFYFDLHTSDKDGNVYMVKYDGELKPAHIPGPDLFASDHTESAREELVSDVETLYLNGDWDLPELGKFQQQVSDVYNFIYSLDDWTASTNQLEKDTIRRAFTGRPFKGGSSYGAYFGDLEKRLKINERVKLKSIEKASPGNMKVAGIAEIFSEVEQLITDYLRNRIELKEVATSCARYLSTEGLATLSVKDFSINDQRGQKLENYVIKISKLLNFDSITELNQITQRNQLGTIKILLSIYRRVSTAAEFFAQGRASFDK